MITTAAAFAAAVAVAGSAPAATAPAPAFRACVAAAPAPSGCGVLAKGSLVGASALALSPGGTRLYAAAYGAGEVVSFKRSAAGRLTFESCVAEGGRGGCAVALPGALDGVGGLAVSPNGSDVYAASQLGRSVSRLTRASTGLAFAACTADRGLHGCADPKRDVLSGTGAVAVGQSGEDVYTASFDAASVSHFKRRADGSLAQVSCVSDGGGGGCTPTKGNILEGAGAVSVAPGGRDLYVTSYRSGALVHFRLTASGGLAYAGCIANAGANGCAKAPAESLTGATGMTFAAGGTRIYVASQAGFVTAFSRDPKTGTTRFLACVGRDGKGPCAEPRYPAAIAGATGIAASGKDVYVTAQVGNALTHLTADAKGRMAIASCVAPKVTGCARGTTTTLSGAYALALGGQDLYVTAPAQATVASFRR